MRASCWRRANASSLPKRARRVRRPSSRAVASLSHCSYSARFHPASRVSSVYTSGEYSAQQPSVSRASIGWPTINSRLSPTCARRPRSSCARQVSTSASAAAATTIACHTPDDRSWISAVTAAAARRRAVERSASELQELLAFRERHGFRVADDGDVHRGAQQTLLRAEPAVDRLDRDAGACRDVGELRRGPALFVEQRHRRGQDLLARLGGLAGAAGRVVGASGSPGGSTSGRTHGLHSRTLRDSIQLASSQSSVQCHPTNERCGHATPRSPDPGPAGRPRHVARPDVRRRARPAATSAPTAS